MVQSREPVAMWSPDSNCVDCITAALRPGEEKGRGLAVTQGDPECVLTRE